MATTSRIAIEKEDGSVDSVYCHFDGYPEYNGRILVENYNTRELATALVALGSLSALSLRLAPEPGESHNFENPIGDVTIAYHRDRDEELEIKHHDSVKSYLKSDIEEYGYLFTKDNEWVYVVGSTKSRKPRPVKGSYKEN